MSTLSSSDTRLMRVLSILAVCFTIALIAVGSLVRVTGSGMGCGDDWPLCQGRLFPPLEAGPLIEWSHRTTAALTSLAIAAVAATALLRHRNARHILIPALLAPAMLALQIIIGAIVVKMELPRPLVAIHMAVAMLIVGALAATVAGAFAQPGQATADNRARLADLQRWALGTALATYLLIVIGSIVVHTGARGVCPDIPLCNGELIPQDSLGLIHMLHRFVAVIVALGAVNLLIRAQRLGIPAYRQGAAALVGLILCQIVVGASNILLGFPELVNVTHLLLAATIWSLNVGYAYHLTLALSTAPAAQPARQSAPARAQG